MANPNAKGRGKPQHECIADIRGSLKRALRMMADDGRPLSTVWLEMFEQDPFRAMQLAIAAQPKQIDATVTASAEEWLERMYDAAQQQSNRAETQVSGELH